MIIIAMDIEELGELDKVLILANLQHLLRVVLTVTIGSLYPEEIQDEAFFILPSILPRHTDELTLTCIYKAVSAVQDRLMDAISVKDGDSLTLSYVKGNMFGVSLEGEVYA